MAPPSLFSSSGPKLTKFSQSFRLFISDYDKSTDGKNTDKRIKDALQRAHDAGLHCIAHTGEKGCAASVREAVHDMYAEDSGHVYHILGDENIYREMKERNVHFKVNSLHPNYSEPKQRHLKNCLDLCTTI
nr:adenosine deaminase [Hymenolepis microstoma]